MSTDGDSIPSAGVVGGVAHRGPDLSSPHRRLEPSAAAPGEVSPGRPAGGLGSAPPCGRSDPPIPGANHVAVARYRSVRRRPRGRRADPRPPTSTRPGRRGTRDLVGSTVGSSAVLADGRTTSRQRPRADPISTTSSPAATSPDQSIGRARRPLELDDEIIDRSSGRRVMPAPSTATIGRVRSAGGSRPVTRNVPVDLGVRDVLGRLVIEPARPRSAIGLEVDPIERHRAEYREPSIWVWRRIVGTAFAFIVVTLAWYLVKVPDGLIADETLPSQTQVASAFNELRTEGFAGARLVDHAAASLARLVIGTLIGATAGAIIGVAIGSAPGPDRGRPGGVAARHGAGHGHRPPGHRLAGAGRGRHRRRGGRHRALGVDRRRRPPSGSATCGPCGPTSPTS